MPTCSERMYVGDVSSMCSAMTSSMVGPPTL
jgi:hypothetical protein